MPQHVDVARALIQRPALRQLWIEDIRGRAESDSRIKSLSLVGSLASGEADDWSDIDLIVECDVGLIQRRLELGASLGEILLQWDAPQNAAPEAMHYCTVYDLGPLPFGVDWHLWPEGSEHPSDSKSIYERAISRRSSLSFDELQKQATEQNKNRALPEMSASERQQFRLSMLYPICKDLARGWPQSAAGMVEWLGFDPPIETMKSWVGTLHTMLNELGGQFPTNTRDKYEALVRLTIEAARDRYDWTS
jgi:predicted nucleotidyltransferase